jgi:hypothetical protein
LVVSSKSKQKIRKTAVGSQPRLIDPETISQKYSTQNKAARVI